MTLPYMLPNRVRVYCRLLMWMCLLVACAHLALALLNGAVSTIVETNFQTIRSEHREYIEENTTKTFFIRALAFVFVVSNLLIFCGMANIFREFTKGEVFAKPAVNAIRVLGVSILIYTTINMFTKTLMLLVWTYDNPEGHRLLSFNVSGYQGMMFLLGGLFVVIGYVYSQAVHMAEENRSYV